MDRRDNRYDRDNRGYDYGSYDDYRNDSHYHSARNLTDQFEQDYQRHSGRRDDRYRVDHTYHEGDMGDFYERRRRETDGYRGYSDNQWSDRDQNRNDFSSFNHDQDRGRYSNYQDDYRSGQDRYRGESDRYGRDWDTGQQGNRREGYLMSNSSVPYCHNSSENKRNSEIDYTQNYNSGIGERYSGSRYSDRSYMGGSGSRNEDDRYNSDRRSYLQGRYY